MHLLYRGIPHTPITVLPIADECTALTYRGVVHRRVAKTPSASDLARIYRGVAH